MLPPPRAVGPGSKGFWMSKSFRARLLAAACGLGMTAGLATAVHAESLADAIALAYQTNPTLQAQRATQRALDENAVQAKANGFRPTVNLTASRQDVDISGGVDRQTTQKGVTFSQPLYTGGRASAVLSASQADIQAGLQNVRRVESVVLLNVITAYVDVRRALESLRISQDNVARLRRQLEESQARFDVGDVTRTDVAQAQARFAAAQAGLSTAQANLGIARASYAALVGQSPADLTPEPSLAKILPATIDEAFAEAIEVADPRPVEGVTALGASRGQVFVPADVMLEHGVTRDDIIQMMVGREITQMFPKETVPIGEVVLSVKNLTLDGVFRDVSFDIHAGEILGLAGLVGSGRSNVAETLFGVTPASSGSIMIRGQQMVIDKPAKAMAAGMAFLTEDRKDTGCFLILDILSNMETAVLQQHYVKFGFVQRDNRDEYPGGPYLIATSYEMSTLFPPVLAVTVRSDALAAAVTSARWPACVGNRICPMQVLSSVSRRSNWTTSSSGSWTARLTLTAPSSTPCITSPT